MDVQACWDEIKRLLKELEDIDENDVSMYADEERMNLKCDIAREVSYLVEWTSKGGYWPRP